MADPRVPTGPPEPAPADPPDAVAVARAYGLGRPTGLIALAARGELGRIWRLETSTGRWAVKELLRPADETAAREDVAFQEAALAAGVPMPRPIPAPDGRVISEVPAPDRRVEVRVYTWVDLAGREVRPAIADAAAILGRLHALAFPARGPVDPWFTAAPGPGDLEGLVAAARAARASWADTLGGLVPLLREGDAIVAAGSHESTIRCHLDFNPENVLVDRQGHPVVVDWENSGPASAEQELASTLAEFVPDVSATRAFLRAYGQAGGPAILRDRSSFAMTLAFQANLVAWYAERALDPSASAEDRARSEHWVRDIAAHVFTVARIDAWLAAAHAAG